MVSATTSNINSKTSTTAGVTLNIITRHSSAIYGKFKAEFLASDYATGIDKVTFHSKLEAAWPTDCATGTMDIGWGGGPTLFDQLISLDLVDPLNDSNVMNEINSIPEDIAGAPMKRYNEEEDLLWVGAAISSFGFTINKAVLDSKQLDYPTTWTQLIQPEYFSAVSPIIAMGNSPDTTSNTRIYEIIIQKFGWNLGWAVLTAMGANSVIKHGSTEVLSAVVNSEAGIGMTIDFYGYGAQLSNPNAEYIIPTGQSIVNADPICLIKGADPAKRDAANKFIEFVLSKEGQQYWLLNNINRMPVRSDAFDTPTGETRQDLYDAFQITVNNKGVDFNDTESLTYHGTLLYYFQATITDAHDELVDAWKAIIAAWSNSGTSNTPRIQNYNLTAWIKKLGGPLVNISEARSLSSALEGGGTTRTNKMNQWTAEAKARYIAIKTAAEAAAETTDSTAPTITNVQVKDFDNVSATITWSTDEDTTSVVKYGLTTPPKSTYSNEEGVLDFSELPVTEHSVKLDNLTSGGKYYFEVSSKDLSGNSVTDDNSGNYYTLTLIDTAPPVISDVIVSPNDDSVVISWVTDEFSDSKINYGTSTSLGETEHVTTEVLVHELLVTGLSKSTKYYFEVISSDGVFFTTDDNSGNYYTSTSLDEPDETPPTVSNIKITVTSTTSTFAFTTDEPTHATLSYGPENLTETIDATKLETKHEILVTDLLSDKTYSYELNITDPWGNSVFLTGTFTAGKTAEPPTIITTTRQAIPGFSIFICFFAITVLIISLDRYKRAKK